MKISKKLEAVLNTKGGVEEYEGLPLLDTRMNSDIDKLGNVEGVALVNLNTAEVICSFCLKEDKAEWRLSDNTNKDDDGTFSTYESSDTESTVQVFAHPYRPYLDIKVHVGATSKPDIHKMSEYVSEEQAKLIASFTDYDIAFVDIQTREISDVDRTIRSFNEDFSIIRMYDGIGSKDDFNFMVAYLPVVK